VPAPDSEWFFPAFVVFWLAICGVLSIMGGWRELAERFKSDAPVEGERFRFRSGAMGSGLFPVSYGGCLFATVGPKGFALSILFLFRFLHPRLVVPWSAVERCEPVKFWFMNYIAVHIVGFGRRVLFDGNLGKKVLETWTQARKSS
jgi:hypothetical protein